MVGKILFVLTLVIGFAISASCTPNQTSPVSDTGIANPAAVFCEKNGGKLELREDTSGGVSGVCIFPDGSECDEWAFYRKVCKPGDSLSELIPSVSPLAAEPSPIATVEIASDGWKIYRNNELGYRFHYPVNTKIIPNDEPLRSISIIPEQQNEQWPAITISNPQDREDYRPPEGTDLPQWLADHYLVGENRAPDVKIAGTTAIHYRHERSPQSYAMDRYFFANKGQLYMIIIGHTEDREDWELYNHFLDSFQFE